MHKNIVLTAGNDLDLLRLRGKVLRSAGFAAEEASSIKAASEMLKKLEPKVLVLCHSLRPDQVDELLELLRSSGSRARTLLMRRSVSLDNERRSWNVDATVSPMDGPEKLIAAVQKLMPPAAS